MASAKTTLKPIRCRTCNARFGQRWHRYRTHPTSTFPFGSVAVTPTDFHPAELIEQHADTDLCKFCHRNSKS